MAAALVGTFLGIFLGYGFMGPLAVNIEFIGMAQVAYADFGTAMMALFLVLWLTAQDSKIKEAIERSFRNPFSAPTKESVGIIPNKDVQAQYQEKGKYIQFRAGLWRYAGKREVSPESHPPGPAGSALLAGCPNSASAPAQRVHWRPSNHPSTPGGSH